MEIYTVKTKRMAFQMKSPIHSRICIYSIVVEQVNCSYYPGYYITEVKATLFSMNIQNYIRAMGMINQMFKPNLVQMHTRIGVYKMKADSWQQKRNLCGKWQAVLVWIIKKNLDILEELNMLMENYRSRKTMFFKCLQTLV
jgi:hypothetical protein